MDKEIKPMDKTPIQLSIEYIDNRLKHYEILMSKAVHGNDILIVQTERDSFISMKTKLQSMLEPERQFAETCFDAGSEFMHNFPKPNAISFDNFYKQYSNE